MKNFTVERSLSIVQHAFDGMLVIDSDKRIILMNKAGMRMFGLHQCDMNGLYLNALIPVRYHVQHDIKVKAFSESDEISRNMQQKKSIAAYGVRKNGDEFPLEVSISQLSIDGKIEMLAIIRDVSVRTQEMEKLLEAATQDELTGLPNKRKFNEELSKAIIRANRYNQPMSMILTDLDNFKRINDKNGHNEGDIVLMRIAKLLQENVRKSDFLCRWGGEEFIILLPNTNLDSALLLAEKLRLAISSRIFFCDENNYTITASFGVTQLDNSKEDSSSFFKRVDSKLYEAKDAGRNCIKF